MGDQNPYERPLVEEKGDLKGYRPKLVSLALGSEDLFSDMVESQRWISRIIRERDDDETRISGKAVVNDTGECLAKMPIGISGGRKALQMTADCNVLDLIDSNRPFMLVPYDKVPFATGLIDSEGLGNCVGVQSIESFVGINVEEMCGFAGKDIEAGIARLVRWYNERIRDCEVGKSLMLVEPEWMIEIVGEWREGEVAYAIVSV